MIFIFAVITIWLICGLGAAGLYFAYFQGEYPNSAKDDYRKDLADGFLFGLIFGPIALLVGFFRSGFAQHGWRLK